MVQFPLQCSKSEVVPVRKPAPELGENTEELLLELGYDRQQMEELKKQKIV